MEMTSWLGGLFGSAFLSATLLPGNSEAALLALLHFKPQWMMAAVIIATVGNVLGGLTSVWLGRRLPTAPEGRAVRLARRFGPVSLLLSWLPLVGDALCAVAGWLRWHWWPVTIWMLVGKAARYAVIAWLAGYVGKL